MREIKFRGKRVDSDEWVYGDLGQIESEAFIYDYDICDNGVSDVPQLSQIKWHINSATVGQFTGLLDKNGKEIYEGDVLRSDEYPYSRIEYNTRDDYYAVVYYCEKKACFGIVTVKNPYSDVGGLEDGIPDDLLQEKMKSFEVVGNIHGKEWKLYGEYLL